MLPRSDMLKTAATCVVLLCLAWTGAVDAQLQTVSYAQSSVPNLANPERGFYLHTETFLSAYEDLSDQLEEVPVGVALILRNYYLDTCKDKDLPADFLAKLSGEFALVRQTGLKMIIRFSYSNDENVPVKDAKPDVVLRHIKQLSRVLTDNVDVIFLVQAGFVGAWGEWYYTTNFPENSPQRDSVIAALLDAFPANRQLAVRTPAFKQKFLNSKKAVSSASEASDTSKPAARLCLHDDCYLMDESDSGTFRDNADQTYAATEASVGLAFGGETCASTKLATSCSSALSYMKKMYTTYLNIGYHPTVLQKWRSGGCFNEMRDRMGYRLVAQQGKFSSKALPGGTVSFELSVKNDGYSPPVNPRDVEVILQGSTRRCVARLDGINPKAWASGSVFTLSASLKLPQDMSLGDYRLLLNLPDPIPSLRARKEYRMVLANTDVTITPERTNDLKHTVQIVRSGSGLRRRTASRALQVPCI